MIWLFKLIASTTALVYLSSFQAMAADTPESTALQKISEETAVLNEKKSKVMNNYQIDVKACWQIFSVNDCLAKAKREKYLGLAPLEQLEIELNTKRRALKEQERLQRLSNKSNPSQSPTPFIKAAP
jgi:hypothetical protein